MFINIHDNKNCFINIQTAILHGSILRPMVTMKNTSRCTSNYLFTSFNTDNIQGDKGRQEQFTLASDSVFERADALTLACLAEGPQYDRGRHVAKNIILTSARPFKP